jgi:hypothetical protein
VWGALHGFGLAVTRFFQRSTAKGVRTVYATFAWCAGIAAAGIVIELVAPDVPRAVIQALFSQVPLTSSDVTLSGTWSDLVFVWLCLTPLWAVVTAWLGADRAESPRPTIPRFVDALRTSEGLLVEALRVGMCMAGAGLLVALGYAETWTWIPLAVLTFSLGLAADLVERESEIDMLSLLRRGLAVVLVFQYVCLAWIFFRASSFDNALAILRQLAGGEIDHANLVPMVTTALAVGFLCHFFAGGSFRWLRDRFMEMPHWGRGLVLAAAVLVLRELSHTKIVPFIYFQF